jgi:hypothetical protein
MNSPSCATTGRPHSPVTVSKPIPPSAPFDGFAA